VLSGSQFLHATHTTILTLLRKHSPDGTTQTRRHTSDIAYYSIYRPRNDERLSWPSWLTYSGRLTHISGHPLAAGRAWDRKVRRSKTNVLTTVPRNQHVVISLRRCQIESLLQMHITNSKWYNISYSLEAIPMTLSHLQGQCLRQAFRCDFCPRDAVFARYLLSSRVRLSVCLSVTSEPELYQNGCRITHNTRNKTTQLLKVLLGLYIHAICLRCSYNSRTTFQLIESVARVSRR